MRRHGFVLVTAILTTFALVPAAVGTEDRPDPGDLTEVAGALSLDSVYTRDAAKADGNKLVSVIIKLDEAPIASYEGGVPGHPATSPKVTGQKKLNPNSAAVKKYEQFLNKNNTKFAADLEAAIPDANVTQTYEYVIGGVAAVVPSGQISRIAKMDGVSAIYVDELNQLDTEVSPGFIGADDLWASLGGQSEAGEGVIVFLRQPETPKDLVNVIESMIMGHGAEDHGDDQRTYGIGAQILADLGVRKMRLLSAPKVFHGLAGFGLEVVDYYSDQGQQND